MRREYHLLKLWFVGQTRATAARKGLLQIAPRRRRTSTNNLQSVGYRRGLVAAAAVGVIIIRTRGSGTAAAG